MMQTLNIQIIVQHIQVIFVQLLSLFLGTNISFLARFIHFSFSSFLSMSLFLQLAQTI